MHLADHLDRVGESRDGRGDEPDRHRAAEPMRQPPGGLEALPHRARVVRAGRGEDDGVARRRVRGRARRSASTATMRSSGPSSSASWAPPPMRSSPSESPVRTWNPAESTSGTMTASGSAAAAERRGDVAVRGVDEADGDVELRSLGCDAVDEADHGLAVLRRGGAVGDGDEAERVCAGDIRRQPGTARPDHVPHPRSPAESGLAAGFDAMHGVFRGRHPRVSGSVKSASRAARPAARRARARRGGQPSSSSGRTRRVRSTCCSRRHAAIAPWLPESSTGGTSSPRHEAGFV